VQGVGNEKTYSAQELTSTRNKKTDGYTPRGRVITSSIV